ncbi:adenylate kinase [Candidatus Pelagibacter sp.]|uniref:adenylate kinase n=1 Tax=Candidatus Pelagibacter sp. TaxID=2024849 RepID=UPI003F8432D0
MNLILFGPPGAGKGTQAKYLVKKLNNFQISTGDMLRDEIQKNSEIGKKIVNDMDDGKFVSDQIVNTLIENVLLDPQKKNRLIFDGYPRSLSQAQNLDILLKKTDQKIDFVFFLNVNKETIIKRIEQRKILEKRSDDDLNTTIKRFDKYMETTKPVLDFYSTNPNFYEIDGASKIEEITAKIDNFIRV